jgi:hypothetical protein
MMIDASKWGLMDKTKELGGDGKLLEQQAGAILAASQNPQIFGK